MITEYGSVTFSKVNGKDDILIKGFTFDCSNIKSSPEKPATYCCALEVLNWIEQCVLDYKIAMIKSLILEE